MAAVFQNCPEVVKSYQRMPTQLLQERLGQRLRGIEDLPRLQPHVLSTVLTLLLPAMLLIVPFQSHSFNYDHNCIKSAVTFDISAATARPSHLELNRGEAASGDLASSRINRCEDVGAGDVRTQAFRASDLGSPMEARMRKGEEFRSGG